MLFKEPIVFVKDVTNVVLPADAQIRLNTNVRKDKKKKIIQIQMYTSIYITLCVFCQKTHSMGYFVRVREEMLTS